jgi:hypothetical protein
MDTACLLRLARKTAPPVGGDPADTELLRRYAAERDEDAFAELVRRNGPLVLRTCRHVLGEAGAEDAFQATFLLLARSAGRLTRSGSLAGWLHAAAVRIAGRARRGEGRRREREIVTDAPQVATDDLTWREVREVLDAELPMANAPEIRGVCVLPHVFFPRPLARFLRLAGEALPCFGPLLPHPRFPRCLIPFFALDSPQTKQFLSGRLFPCLAEDRSSWLIPGNGDGVPPGFF